MHADLAGEAKGRRSPAITWHVDPRCVSVDVTVHVLRDIDGIGTSGCSCVSKIGIALERRQGTLDSSQKQKQPIL